MGLLHAGMLPFARSLLKMKTQVILAANSAPVLNDITAPELQLLVDLVGQEDDLIAQCSATQCVTLAPLQRELLLLTAARIVGSCE